MIERAIAFLLLVGAVLALASVMNGPSEPPEEALPDARPDEAVPRGDAAREEAPPEENEDEEDRREERKKKGKDDDDD